MSKTDERQKVTDDAIIRAFRQSPDGYRTAPELADRFDMSRQGMSKRLKQLSKDNVVEQQKINETTAIWELANPD